MLGSSLLIESYLFQLLLPASSYCLTYPKLLERGGSQKKRDSSRGNGWLLKVVDKESRTPKRNLRRSSPHGTSICFLCFTCKLNSPDTFTGLTRARFFNDGTSGAAPVFAQWLKASTHPKYAVSQNNTYPTGASAVQIVTTLVFAWLSDSVLNGARWPPIVLGGIINIICYVSLAI